MLSFVVLFLIVLLFRFVPIPTTPYMVSEGSISQDLDKFRQSIRQMYLAIVAAEDANF